MKRVDLFNAISPRPRRDPVDRHASAGLWAASVAAVLALALLPAQQRGYAAAVVGAAHLGQPSSQPARTPEAIKGDYRRPDAIPFPQENPYTPRKAGLGKRLYFDPRLSGSNALSCASCHNPALGWGDGLPKAVGHGMHQLGRRSPTIINAAWGQIFMWDGRAASLEEQALGPIQSETEMNMPLDRLTDRVGRIAEYKPLFDAAFPNEGVAPTTIAKAIATYERTIVSNPASFDAWIEGQDSAISAAAKRGFVLFNTKARCASCHAGWNFTDDSFHDTGLGDDDLGRGRIVTGVVKMQHAFKTPGLRDVLHRGPYMHDGSLATLEEVVELYDRGGIDRPSRSDLIVPLRLAAQEKSDLVSFLGSLEGSFEHTVFPILPR